MEVQKSLIGLIGDIGHCFQHQATRSLRQKYIIDLLNAAMESEETVQVARWAMSIVNALK